MNITQHKYSLLELCAESFRVISRCAARLLLVYIIATALLCATQMLTRALGIPSPTNSMAILSSPQIGILYLFNNLVIAFMLTVCIRIISAQVKNENLPLFEIFSSSVVPTLFLIVAGILGFVAGGIVFAIVILLSSILASLLNSTVLYILLLGGFMLFVCVRFCYSSIAIAIEGKGPISGYVHSWKMTRGNCADTLAMLGIVCVMFLPLTLFFMAIVYAGYILIPLYFANSFNLAHPSPLWMLVGGIISMIFFMFSLIILAFVVLVFINRNAMASGISFERDTTFVPLPGFTLPDVSDNPAHAQQAETTMPIPKEEAQQALQTPQQTEQPTPTVPELKVTQASIQTDDTETEDLSEHLNQVYTPKPEDIVQYGDEDRMPTILFDDEMAKQLQENQAQFAKRKKDDTQNDKKDGPDSIKMSKF